MGPIQTLEDVLDMVRRRWRIMAVIVVIGCAVSVIMALGQTHLYRSTEVLQVASPRIAGDLAPTTVEGSAARRFQVVEQVLMSRNNVLEMIEEFGLFQDLPELTDTEKVVLFRNSTRIKGVAAVGTSRSEHGSVAILTFAAELPSPYQAQQVAHELAQRTIALSRDARLTQAKETLDFFKDEERKLVDQVSALDIEIEEYRTTHAVALPGEVEFRRNQIAAINDELLTIDREIIGVQRSIQQIDPNTRQATRERLTADFRAELTRLSEQRELLASRRDELSRALETTPEITRELGVFERRLEQLQNQLAVVTARRTEAEVGFKLESEGSGQRLTVLEEATLPDYPFTSSRKKQAVLGAAVSLVLAFVVAFLLELRKPVIRSAAQMKRELGFDPVVSIPQMDLRPEEKRRRRKRG